ARNNIKFFQFVSPATARRMLREEQFDPETREYWEALAGKKGGNSKKRSSRVSEFEEDDEDYSDDDEDEDIDEDLLEEKIALQSMVPFTVIAQEEGVEIRDPETDELIRGREFPWGILNVLNPDHCDLEGLRSALLSTHRT